MSITVSVKCSTGDKFTVEVETSQLVSDFKRLLAEKSKIPAEQQRLIFSGHVLKDPQTLESYSIKDGSTVHLVRGASSTPTPAQPTQTATNDNTAPPNPTTNADNPFAAFAGADPLLGGFGGMPSLQQMQAQMAQNPGMVRELMNSPEMQSMMQNIMQNPELVRNMIMGNPQMREVIERNPEVGHMLNDPAVLRQTMQMATNPELMREMMRNTDRAMSNIENHPEGFNLLRRMYTNVQEPMMNATQANGGGATNPFASLFNTGTANSAPPATPAGNPNTAPLPNPWAPAAPATGSTAPQSLFGNPGLANLFGGAGATPTTGSTNTTGAGNGVSATASPANALGDFGNLFGGAPPPDPTSFMNMLQAPGVQQMMQHMFQNPEVLQQMLSSNPMMRQAMDSNPMLAQQLQNPEFLRQMANPQNIQAMLQMQQAMQQLQGSGLFGGLLGAENPGNMGNLDFLQNLMGGDLAGLAGGFGSAGQQTQAAQPPQQPPEERFRVQLEQLNDMGFTDRAQNIVALTATNGNVNAAIERLLR
jgi:ubiquilin